MNRINLVVFLMILSVLPVLALQVNVDELKAGGDIEFINYTGPHDRIETAFQIRSIGERLASGVKDDNQPFVLALKYTIIHAINAEKSELMDSAILSFEKDAQVDHINNVRLIISGYLQRRYGYSAKDARTLAIFITIYNAVYRGNVDYFAGKYKPIVMAHLDKTNAGLSTRYFEWPGQTRILIPLTDNPSKGNLSSLDTTELTNKKILEEMRKDDDRNIDTRKDIVKLKEKEVDQKNKDILKETKQLEDEKRKLEEEQKKIDEMKKIADQKKEELQKKEEQLLKEKELAKTEEEKKEVQRKEDELQKEKDKLTEDQKKLEDQQKKSDEKTTDLQKKEEMLTEKKEEVVKKIEEIQTDKQDIKKDEADKKIESDPNKMTDELRKKNEELAKKEEELDKREDALKNSQTDDKIFANRLFYLKIKDYMEGGHYNNEMVLINVETRKLEGTSEINTICGHKYDIFKDGVVVIAHKGSHNQAHNLVIMDRNTLKVKSRGNEDIFWRSFVEVKDDFIYAVIKDGERAYYLGKFNEKMELISKSEEAVDSNTFISFYKDTLYINSAAKGILVLNRNDLKLVDKIEP